MGTHVSLVGMSNIGKSYWSQLLESEGYRRICCDDLIAERLKPQLNEEGYSASIEDVAAWMGLPHEPKSDYNQATYLEREEFVVVDSILTLSTREDVVIDTTGSMAHLPRAVQRLLKSSTIVLYLETPPEKQQDMLERFLVEPKPVCWAGHYVPTEGESHKQTLARCYPRLLATRAATYERLSDVKIPYELHRNSRLSITTFREIIERTRTRRTSWT
jgi:shikimate kinase